ncbi:MAG: VCBS repeat-containing protein, partial [Deltaproteobacteria bacterium]
MTEGVKIVLCVTMSFALSMQAGCSSSAGGTPCSNDDDCPAGQFCDGSTCRPADEGDAGADGGDGWHGGDGWAGTDGVPDTDYQPCDEQSDCPQGLVCLNHICVDVLPWPDCKPGNSDDCPGDRYCSPEQGGCVPWPAHPQPMPRCEYIPPAGQFTPKEEWVWEQPAEAPEWNQVMMTPVVVPLAPPAPGDTPSPPAVLCNSFRADRGYSQDGILRAVSGVNGSTIFSVTDPQYYTHPVSGIAAADIDGDARPEIVTGKNGGHDLICFEHDGKFKWATDTGSLNIGWGGPAIANLDGEGPPEIVVGAAVVSADGQVLWAKSGSQG